MKYNRNAGITLVLISLLMLMGTPQTAVTAQNPEVVSIDGTLSAQEGNDVFFQASGVHQLLQTSFWNSQQDMELYKANPLSYYYDQYISAGNVNQLSAATDIIYHLRNTTNSPLSVDYQGFARDLSTGGMANFEMKGDQVYLFEYQATAFQPFTLFFDTFSSEWFEVVILDPSGDISSRDYYISADYPENIPIVPFESGTYHIAVIADDPTFIEEFDLLNGQNLTSVSDSVNGTFNTVDSNVQFFRFNGQSGLSLDAVNFVEFNGFLDMNWGSGGATVTFFSEGTTSPLGVDNSLTAQSDKDTFAALVVNVLDETRDPNADRVREVFDTYNGVGTSFNILKNNLPTMGAVPFDQNIRSLPNVHSNSYNYYTYSTSQDVVIGINGTTGVFFRNAEDSMNYWFYPDTNDVLHDYQDVLQVLPAGEYIVGIPTFDTVFLSEFVPISPSGDSFSFSSTMNTVQIFEIPANIGPDLFNVTYNSLSNNSVSMRFSIHNIYGGFDSSHSYVFDNFKGTSTTFYDNNTAFWTLVEGNSPSFLRVDQYANEIYNDSSTSTLFDLLRSNDPTEVSDFSIETSNYIDYLTVQNPNNRYITENVDTPNPSLLGLDSTETYVLTTLNSIDDYWAYLNLELQAGGYIFTLTDQNRGFSYLLASASDSISSNTVLVDGTTTITFAVGETTDFTLVLDTFSAIGLNGQISVEMTYIEPTALSEPNIGSIVASAAPEVIEPYLPGEGPTQDDGPLGVLPIAFGIVAVAVIVRIRGKK